MKAFRWVALGVGVVVVVGFALFVWPTQYHWHSEQVGSNLSLVVRVNRFTQQTEILHPTRGWYTPSDDAKRVAALTERDNAIKKKDEIIAKLSRELVEAQSRVSAPDFIKE